LKCAGAPATRVRARLHDWPKRKFNKILDKMRVKFYALAPRDGAPLLLSGLAEYQGGNNTKKAAILSRMRAVSFEFSWGKAGSGGAEGNRTPDLLIANEALSQLSYSPCLKCRT
jgi:hypothetical protein